MIVTVFAYDVPEINALQARTISISDSFLLNIQTFFTFPRNIPSRLKFEWSCLMTETRIDSKLLDTSPVNTPSQNCQFIRGLFSMPTDSLAKVTVPKDSLFPDFKYRFGLKLNDPTGAVSDLLSTLDVVAEDLSLPTVRDYLLFFLTLFDLFRSPSRTFQAHSIHSPVSKFKLQFSV